MKLINLPETGPVACDQCGATDHEMWVERFGCVTEKLSEALVLVLDAAKSVAFQEARDRHARATTVSPNEGTSQECR